MSSTAPLQKEFSTLGLQYRTNNPQTNIKVTPKVALLSLLILQILFVCRHHTSPFMALIMSATAIYMAYSFDKSGYQRGGEQISYLESLLSSYVDRLGKEKEEIFFDDNVDDSGESRRLSVAETAVNTDDEEFDSSTIISEEETSPSPSPSFSPAKVAAALAAARHVVTARQHPPHSSPSTPPRHLTTTLRSSAKPQQRGKLLSKIRVSFLKKSKSTALSRHDDRVEGIVLGGQEEIFVGEEWRR